MTNMLIVVSVNFFHVLIMYMVFEPAAGLRSTVITATSRPLHGAVAAVQRTVGQPGCGLRTAAAGGGGTQTY